MSGARGFTYIELVITVAIVAVLASGALPLLEMSAKRSKELELRSALREVREGIDRYKKAWDDGHITRREKESGYPRSLEMLVEGVEDAKSPGKARLYFMRRLPRDPFATEPGSSAAESWGRRSYASSPDAPVEGDDVFDVYTRSTGRGFNGVSYRDW